MARKLSHKARGLAGPPSPPVALASAIAGASAGAGAFDPGAFEYWLLRQIEINL